MQVSEAYHDFFANLLPVAEEVDFVGNTAEREFGGNSGLQLVEILEERGVRAADMEPIGDPQAAELLRRLSELGIPPDQAAQELRRLRTTRQDLSFARRARSEERRVGQEWVSPGRYRW